MLLGKILVIFYQMIDLQRNSNSQSNISAWSGESGREIAVIPIQDVFYEELKNHLLIQVVPRS